MALRVKLPWELEEDILSRLPPKSLVRFRIVCQKWNSLFTDKSFLKYHLSRSRPQFIFLTDSKIHSIDIINHNSNNPTLEVCELPSSDLPNRNIHLNYSTIITTCDEFFFYNIHNWRWGNKTALWNPWLRQVRWIEYENKQFYVFGFGYDNSRPEKVYKILVYFVSHGKMYRREDEKVAIYEFASQALKFIDKPNKWPITEIAKRSNVSLNGNLYWFTCNDETHEYFIQIFDFSKENFEHFCRLPCQKNHNGDELTFAVYKGDRFSLLKQCCVTREIEIWVTTKRIGNNNNGVDGEGVVWRKKMIFSTTNMPKLYSNICRNKYFFYEKTLFICGGDDGTRAACIIIVRKDLCKKILLNCWYLKCCHYVYTPNLMSVPF